MIRIEIQSEAVTERNITSKAGRPLMFREQVGYAYLQQPNGQPEPHPTKISITLETGALPYKAGNYTLEASSLYVNRFNQLEVGRLKLKSLDVAAGGVRAWRDPPGRTGDREDRRAERGGPPQTLASASSSTSAPPAAAVLDSGFTGSHVNRGASKAAMVPASAAPSAQDARGGAR